MYYIYKFYNQDDEVIYVGKTIDIKQRFYQHSKKDWWHEVVKIEISELETKLWWDIYEQFYINKHKTKYNVKDTKIKYKKFDYPELDFKIYKDKIKNK